MESKVVNPLVAKRKFVEALTRYTKYMDNDDFLTPKMNTISKHIIGIEEPNTIEEMEEPKPKVKKDVEAKKEVEKPKPKVKKDVEAKKEVEKPKPEIEKDVEAKKEVDINQLNSNDFNRILSLLDSQQKKRKKKIPDWAKLAMASNTPNSDIDYY